MPDVAHHAEADSLSAWMAAMTESLRAINEERDLSRVLDLVAQHACTLLDLRQVAVYILDPTTESFTIGGSYGLTKVYVDTVNAEPIRLGEARATYGPPTARAVLINRPVVVGNAFTEPGLDRWRQNMALEGLQTIVAAPLRGSDGEPLGTITGFAEAVDAISERELTQIALLADHAAAAIVAARRRDREREANKALHEVNLALLAQQRTVSDLRDLQHKLTQLVLQEAALPEIVEFLGDRLHADVYLDTLAGEPLACAGLGTTSDLPKSLEQLRDLPQDWVSISMDSGRATQIPADGDRAMFLVPVPQAGAREQARMWVRHRRASGFDEDAVRAMEGCALLIALQRSGQEIQAHAEARLVRELLADLLSPAAMMHSTAVMARAVALGHDPNSAHVPIVGMYVSGEANDPHEQRTGRLTSSLTTALRGVRPKPVIGTVGDVVVGLLPGGSGSTSIKAFSEFVQRSSFAGLRWIVGSSAPTLRESQDPLNTALRAAQMLTVDSAPVIYLESLGVPALLLETGTSERLLALAESTLGAVLTAERAKPGGLLETLLEWFRNGMSTKQTAEKLRVHTNTVSYRLRRIGELSGLRLTDPGDLMSIRLALDILQVRGLASGDLLSAPAGPSSNGSPRRSPR